MLNSPEHEISTAHKNRNAEKKFRFFLLSKLSDVVLMLINVKMPTIVDILIFIISLNFMLC